MSNEILTLFKISTTQGLFLEIRKESVVKWNHGASNTITENTKALKGGLKSIFNFQK